ncbi:TIGR03016 family PEP-CTERM system-associated outer membrane protein [Roseateles sp.]
MTRRRAELRCLAFALATSAALAQAQQNGAAASGGMTLVPRLGVTQTWTDNLRLNDQNKDAALITTVSPGINLVSNSGSLRGTLDYSLNGIAYLKSDQPARLQNALSANLQAELVSRVFFVNVLASIGQQSTSAFGVQSAPTLDSQSSTASLLNENQRETGTLTVSPLLRGMLGGLATYELRGDFTRTEVRGSNLGDSRGRGGSIFVNQANAGVLSWWLQANSQRVNSALTESNRSETLRIGLNYRPDPDWSLRANTGYERSNYLGGGNANGVTSGINAEWTPTPRTHVNADWQRHNYGNSHALSVEHRMSRSVWRLSDTQSVMLGNTGSSGGVRSNYDQFFLLFASIEPDPVKRDTFVRAYLQSQGLSPDAAIASGFLSAGPSRLRSQVFSVTLQGVRSSLTAQINRSLTSRLGDNQNQGDLASSGRIEQRSYSLTASHQFTPLTGLAVSASRQETTGNVSNQFRSQQLTSLMANCNVRLGPRLVAQLGARNSRFEGVISYTENAVYASLTQQF